jgi:hypothetical protein
MEYHRALQTVSSLAVTYLVTLLPRQQIDQVVLERRIKLRDCIITRYFSVLEAETLDTSKNPANWPLFDVFKAEKTSRTTVGA